MTTQTTAFANLQAKLNEYKEKNSEKNAIKLKIVNEIYSCVREAQENGGCTFAEMRHVVTVAGCAAKKFAEDSHFETAAERAESAKQHSYDLQAQIRAMSLGAALCGIEDADSRKYPIEVLSFAFERNQQSLASLFDFWWQKDDSRKIHVLDTICKNFTALKIGYARNIPKFDQTFIDAGVC